MKVQFSVDPQYRRELFLEGFDVETSYELDCPAASLTKTQRQFILHLTQGQAEGIPPVVFLVVPKFSAEQNKIVHEHWSARIHPDPYGLGEILDMWMQDYQRYYTDAKAVQAEQAQSSLPDLF